MLDANGIPDLHVMQDSTYDFESSGFANAEFLKKVTYGKFMTMNNMLEWQYEQRRMAQRILPFLYLGPLTAVRDQAFLQREGVTMVLAVRNTKSAQAKLLGMRAAEELGLHTKMIDVAGNQELIAAFPTAIELINLHLSTVYENEQAKALSIPDSFGGYRGPTSGKVLVFCETGNERSAAVVTAYIMAMYAVNLVTAIQIVQAQRFAVSFDDSMRNLLSTYEIILQAKRDVVQADSHGNKSGDGVGSEMSNDCSISGTRTSSKRRFDTAYNDSMDVDERDEYADASRFDRRTGSAPFQDRLDP